MGLIAEAKASDVESQSLLDKILRQLCEATSLTAATEAALPDILKLLGAERLSVYRRDKQSGEMVSRYNVAGRQQDIRLLISTTSIAGYCALSRQVINIEDVYDAQVLTKIHPRLVFQGFFDRAYGFRTKAVLVAPIVFTHKSEI